MKKLNCLLFALFLLNLCFARKKLALEITFEQDTVHHLQSINYQIKWRNRTNDTISVRDDRQRFGRPKLEARRLGTKEWKTLWLSERPLFKTCWIESFGFGWRHPRYWVLPPRSSSALEVAYFPIWEQEDQAVLVPGYTYEFRFVLTDEQRKIGVKQTTDTLYIDYSSVENEQAIAAIHNAQLNPYDLFKSWQSCIVDTLQFRTLQEIALRHPESEIAGLIELKLMVWHGDTMDQEDFAENYTKGELLQALERLKNMLGSDFYDPVMISELIYKNLEKGLENGYTLDEYFDNIIFIESSY